MKTDTPEQANQPLHEEPSIEKNLQEDVLLERAAMLPRSAAKARGLADKMDVEIQAIERDREQVDSGNLENDDIDTAVVRTAATNPITQEAVEVVEPELITNEEIALVESTGNDIVAITDESENYPLTRAQRNYEIVYEGRRPVVLAEDLDTSKQTERPEPVVDAETLARQKTAREHLDAILNGEFTDIHTKTIQEVEDLLMGNEQDKILNPAAARARARIAVLRADGIGIKDLTLAA